MNYYACKISITLPEDVLCQLDEVAKLKYLSRSNAIRIAILDWIESDPDMTRVAAQAMGGSGLTREEELDRLLTAKQVELLNKFKNDEIEFNEFIKHFPTNVYLELLKMGEI